MAGVQPLAVVAVIEDITAGVFQAHALHVGVGGLGIVEAGDPGRSGHVCPGRQVIQRLPGVRFHADCAGHGSAAVKIHPAGAVLQRHRRYGGFGKRRLSGLLIFHCQRLCRQQRPPDRCFDSGLLRFPDHHIRVSGGFDRVGSPFVPRQVKVEITVGVIAHVLPGHNKAHRTQNNKDQQDGQENFSLPASPAIAAVSSGA